MTATGRPSVTQATASHGPSPSSAAASPMALSPPSSAGMSQTRLTGRPAQHAPPPPAAPGGPRGAA